MFDEALGAVIAKLSEMVRSRVKGLGKVCVELFIQAFAQFLRNTQSL